MNMHRADPGRTTVRRHFAPGRRRAPDRRGHPAFSTVCGLGRDKRDCNYGRARVNTRVNYASPSFLSLLLSLFHLPSRTRHYNRYDRGRRVEQSNQYTRDNIARFQ